ncbi:MAG: hypothetical protein MUC49_10310 [Raineya sp.]|jgi:hypothetical protein|nr:hypothetical protein [Raineya sp.]
MALKNLLLISLFTISYLNGYAQETFVGKIVAKPWSKTTESYCAQGSDYYVLEQKDKSAIVIQKDKVMDLKKWQGKDVQIKGKIETKEIKPSNPMEQRPVTLDIDGKEVAFTCSVLVIQEIKAFKKPRK